MISMIGIVAMNVTDILLTGSAILTWWVIPIMLAAGFIILPITIGVSRRLVKLVIEAECPIK